MNDVVQKFVSWAVIALVLLVLEMRLEVGRQSDDINRIRNDVDKMTLMATNTWEEQLKRKEVIDWVREFRQFNGWETSPKNYYKGEQNAKR